MHPLSILSLYRINLYLYSRPLYYSLDTTRTNQVLPPHCPPYSIHNRYTARGHAFIEESTVLFPIR